jgi:hypothetical protein
MTTTYILDESNKQPSSKLREQAKKVMNLLKTPNDLYNKLSSNDLIEISKFQAKTRNARMKLEVSLLRLSIVHKI